MTFPEGKCQQLIDFSIPGLTNTIFHNLGLREIYTVDVPDREFWVYSNKPSFSWPGDPSQLVDVSMK